MRNRQPVSGRLAVTGMAAPHHSCATVTTGGGTNSICWWQDLSEKSLQSIYNQRRHCVCGTLLCSYQEDAFLVSGAAGTTVDKALLCFAANMGGQYMMYDTLWRTKCAVHTLALDAHILQCKHTMYFMDTCECFTQGLQQGASYMARLVAAHCL